MAARLTATRPGRALGVLLALAVGLAGCVSPDRPGAGGGGGPPRPTPLASYSTQVEGTVTLLRRALGNVRLAPPMVDYQPGEPAGVATAPRAILQADVRDPQAGWVLVYEFRDAATAATRGAEFADYLESGFGQTNYPLDARFSLAQVGATLVFTWYSPERVADREASEAAFEAIASVGSPIEIVR